MSSFESNRVRVAITTGEDSSTVTSTERLAALVESMEGYGPEPEGIVLGVHEAALEELPPAWTWERLPEGGPDGG